jgi:type IV secretion system protein TrbL
LNFGSWLYSAYGSFITNTIPEASVSGYEFSIKSSGSLDIMSGFMEYYMQIIVNGARYIQGPVLKLLLILALINASMQLALDLISGDKIKFMIKETLKTGFYIFLITNWIGGMDLMQALSNGFETIGFLASGGSDYKPDSIVQNGIKMFQSVYDSMTFQLNLSTILTLICLITIVVCIFITGLEMFMARIEFWTMALVTIPLLPFGMVKQFNFLSEKAIGAMFNLAIKVCVIAFISGIAAPLLTSLAKKMADSSDISTDISLLFQSVIASLILVLLTKKVPSLVQGLLAGQPSLAGGDMKKMMMTAVQTTANAAGAGRMAVQAANGSKVKAMSEMAKYAFRKNPVTTGYYAGKQDFKNTQGLANKVDLKDNKK